MKTVNNDIYNHIHDTWWNKDGFMAMLRTSVNPPRFGYFHHTMVKKLRINPDNLSVLDVGCGGGFLSEQFASIGCTVTGIDPSLPTLNAARAHAKLLGLRINYVEGNGENMPFESQQYDMVCCCDVLEHVADIDTVISEIARVLKPGGILFYDTINRTIKSKLIAIKFAQEWPLTRFMPNDVHVWEKFIRPDELSNSFEKSGLINSEMTGLSLKINPVKGLLHFVRQKLGRISYAELGSKLILTESKDLDISYMGYAVRS